MVDNNAYQTHRNFWLCFGRFDSRVFLSDEAKLIVPSVPVPLGHKSAVAADGFLLGQPAFFTLGNEPALLANLAKFPAVRHLLAEPAQQLLIRFPRSFYYFYQNSTSWCD